MTWAKVLNESLVGKMKNLEGLKLTMTYHIKSRYVQEHSVVARDTWWLCCGLVALVRFFQKHKLKNELTQIRIVNGVDLYDYIDESFARDFIDSIRSYLLN